jgi:hypothetical protein
VESILNKSEAAFSRAATLLDETFGSIAESTIPAVPEDCLISLTRFRSFLTLSKDF